MSQILVLSSSIRNGRKSHRVAQYIYNTINGSSKHMCIMADLLEYDFPIFRERLKFMPDAPTNLLKLSEDIKASDAVIIVSPEYNASMPASLKNVIDVFNDEWRMKPIGLCGVSGGAFGGSQVLQAMQLALHKVGAWVVPASFQVPFVDKAFDENSQPADPEGTLKRFQMFMDKLEWCIQASKK